MNGAGFGEGMFLLLKNWYGLYAQLYMQRHACVHKLATPVSNDAVQHSVQRIKFPLYVRMCAFACCSSTNLSMINEMVVTKGGK